MKSGTFLSPSATAMKMTHPLRSSFWAACALLLVMLAGPKAAAQSNPRPPGKMAFQGFLTDSSGVARGQSAPQNYTITFRLYKTATGDASTAIWAESQVVTVDKGHFSVILGEGTSVPGTTSSADLSGFFIGADASDRFLGVQVGTESEVAPRIQFLSAPYAQSARYANELIGTSGSSVLVVGAGTVGIGLASGVQPSQALEVNGRVKANGFMGDGSSLTNIDGANIKDTTIKDAKLDKISTAGKVLNSATSATTNNTSDTIVLRDKNGDFSAGTIAAKGLNSAGSAFVNGVVNVSDGGSRTYNAGVSTEVNGALINFGVNDTRFGPTNIGAQGGFLRLDVRSGQNLFQFNARPAGSAQTAVTEVMSITAAGNVGIGTTPTQAKLAVKGSFGTRPYNAAQLWDGYLYANQNILQSTASIVAEGGFAFTPSSIYADGYVQASAFVAFSDERVKNIQGRSDNAADLATLLGIEVTDYRYKDTLTKGNALYKKVIAQQVEKVFPQAVSKGTDVVPDIYKAADYKDGWVQLTTDLKKGDRVRLIGKNSKEAIQEVLEVGKDRFRTSFDPEGDRVFVYGREVKDFRSVDYEAIAMLNVSATQQIKKEKDAEVKALQEENSALRARLETLEARDKTRSVALEQVETMRNELAALKKMVAQLAAARDNGPAIKAVALGEGATNAER